jgi:hypothetical protein
MEEGIWFTVEHEHHHENDAREVWFQAHVRFLNRPINDLATINRIIDYLVQQYDGHAAVLDARDNTESSKLQRCCAGATYVTKYVSASLCFELRHDSFCKQFQRFQVWK